MKRITIFVLIITLLFSACSNASMQGSSIPDESSLTKKPESTSQPSVSSADENSQVKDKVGSDYPEQAMEYLRMSLDGSAFVYLNQSGEHGELKLPNVNYSEAQMAPDGNHILCKTNAGGAGESRWSGYTVVSLITNPTETYAYNGEQWGYQDHIWLDDNIIGFADGSVIGGQEDTWQSIQLFDSQYNSLNVPLQFLTDNPGITGIGYDKANKQYIIAYAESMPASDMPFAINRLMLSVFDDNGVFVKEIGIPEEYQSPYSPNLLVLTPNNPVVTAEGHILISVQRRIDNKRVLLVLSPENQVIQELPYCDSLRLSADGKTAFAITYDTDSNSIQPAILYFEGRKDAAVQELPADLFVVDRYSGQFVPFDAVIRDQHMYIMAENYTDTGEAFCGLFYWNIIEDKNAEHIELLQVLPGRGYCNLAGVDNEGFCYVLVNGVVPESADGDVHEQLKERREQILSLIG